MVVSLLNFMKLSHSVDTTLIWSEFFTDSSLYLMMGHRVALKAFLKKPRLETLKLNSLVFWGSTTFVPFSEVQVLKTSSWFYSKLVSWVKASFR